MSATSLDDARALVRLFYEAVDGADASAVDALLTDGFRLHLAGAAEPLDRHGLAELNARVAASAGPLRHTVEDQVAEGDTVATRLTFHGASSAGVLVQGAAIAMHRVVDGAIAEQWVVLQGDGVPVVPGPAPTSPVARPEVSVP